MNKKLIKTITSITCGLGIVVSIPFVATSCGSSLTPISKIEIKYTGTKNLSLKVNETPTFAGTFSILENGYDKTSEYDLVLSEGISNNLRIIDNKLSVYKEWTQNYNADFYVKVVNKGTNESLAYLDGFTISVTGADTDKTIVLTSSISGRICDCQDSSAVQNEYKTDPFLVVNTIGLPDDAQFNWCVVPESPTTTSDFSEWLVNGKINVSSENNSHFSLNFQFLKTSMPDEFVLYFYIFCQCQQPQIISNKIHGFSISICC